MLNSLEEFGIMQVAAVNSFAGVTGFLNGISVKHNTFICAGKHMYVSICLSHLFCLVAKIHAYFILPSGGQCLNQNIKRNKSQIFVY